jgi:P4 family phage/plasmid primase-like protien
VINFTHFNSQNVAKRIELVSGHAVKKPAETFKSGPFKTVNVTSMRELAEFLETLTPGDFITAGVNQTQSSGECGLGDGDVHRTKEDFPFASGKPGLLIIDGDHLEALKLHDIDSFAGALEELIGNADYALSPSASSGITVNSIVGPIKGMHAFVFIHDASQIPETLEILHKRAVILGYGYPLITKAGVILIRSLVDTAMKTSNQPCFEGGALLADGITQDRKISYRQHCDEPRYLNVVPLSLLEDDEFEIKTKELTGSVSEEAAAIRAAWCEARGKTMVEKGCEPQKVKAILDSALSGERPVLEGDFEIHTDKFGIKTVRELLSDRKKYHEETCADPLDPDDGVGKAKIYTLNTGSPAINSFAHGGSVYILQEEHEELFKEIDESLIDHSDSQKNATTVGDILEVVDRTDSGNVAILYKITNGNLRYVPELKCFMAWHNKRWVMDPSGVHAHEMGLGVANDYSEQAKKVLADSLQPHLSDKESGRMQAIANSIEKWAEQCRNKFRLDAMLSLAQRDRRFVFEVSKLDQNPYLLGAQNGVINLRTGDLQADSRSDFVTKRCSVAYNPTAKAERWEVFISEITSFDGRLIDGVLQRTERPRLADYLQKLFGYGITGSTVEQLLIIMWGLGSNGKNVLLDTVLKVAGDYAETISPEILMATKFDNGADSATPSIRKLAGARIAISSESKEGQKLEAAIVKRHTGGGFITARGLHQSPVTFPITHKLILMTNTPPPVDHMDAAMQGRINMIPFDMRWNRPGEVNPDPNLPNAQKDLMAVLDDELEGILLWLVQGAVAYCAEGLQPPTEVTLTTRSYLDSQDSIKQWLASYEKCTPPEGGLAGNLFRKYEAFCRDEDLQVNITSPAGLGRKLKSIGYQNKKGREGMRYGLREAVIDVDNIPAISSTTNAKDSNDEHNKGIDPDLVFEMLREDAACPADEAGM